MEKTVKIFARSRIGYGELPGWAKPYQTETNICSDDLGGRQYIADVPESVARAHGWKSDEERQSESDALYQKTSFAKQGQQS